MINNKPNVFEFATKELSQDAVFMYLFDCYNSSNLQEKAVGKDFIDLIFRVQKKRITKHINRVSIKKQYHKIDVLVLLEYDDETTDAVIIEDKTFSSEHDNQLARYYRDIKDNGVEKITKVDNIIGLYFKLGTPTESEQKALIVDDGNFEYCLLRYDSFILFLEQHKETNYLMELIYEYYYLRVKEISLIDSIDFSNPGSLDFNYVLSNSYSQFKYLKWIMNKVFGYEQYHEVNQYNVGNYGRPCTQYRFIFTEEVANDKKWDCITDDNIRKYNYFFRMDKNTKGWYIAINQYERNGDENWDEKRKDRDFVRKRIKDIIEKSKEKYNVNDYADNKGKKESKICLFIIKSFDDVENLIPMFKEICADIIRNAI